MEFTFTAADIGGSLGEDLSPERWRKQDVDAARRQLASVEEDQALLARASMQEL
jgi:hypothetical protein